MPVPGLVAVAGGKYTTYRVMARDAIDAVARGLDRPVPPSATARDAAARRRRLPGAVEPARAARRRRAACTSRGSSTCCGRYGTRIDELLAHGRRAPASWASRCRAPTTTSRSRSRYAATHEGALHLDDVLTRRTRISIETWDRGLEAAEPAARLMAEVLGWDEASVGARGRASTARASRPNGARRSSPTTRPPTSSASARRTCSPDADPCSRVVVAPRVASLLASLTARGSRSRPSEQEVAARRTRARRGG